MTQVAEAALAEGPLSSALRAGLESIDQNQTVQFTKYTRIVLPLDGFVFWAKASLIAQAPDNCLTAKGSLHYATDTEQEEVLSYSINRVIFTSENEIRDLNDIAPDALYIGTFDGLRFAFSSRGSFYRQANLSHYVGRAVYSDLASQIIDTQADLADKSLVVSNSLPIWLALNGYAAAPYEQFSNPGITLYPSYLVPGNLTPPFGSVHIEPNQTRGLQNAPYLDRTLTHSQLATDHVKITLYGLRNDAAQTFLDLINQYSMNSGLFGLMTNPVMRDEKRWQNEINALAIKKCIEFDINYYQSSVRDVARQMIETVIPTFYISNAPIPINA